MTNNLYYQPARGGQGGSGGMGGTGGIGGNGGVGGNSYIEIYAGTITVENIGAGIGGEGGQGGLGGDRGNGGTGGAGGVTLSGGSTNIGYTGASGSYGVVGINGVDGLRGASGVSSDIVVVGGSVNMNTSSIPSNGAANGNQNLRLVVVEVEDTDEVIEKITIVGADYYAFDSMEPDAEGKLYLWLPTHLTKDDVYINHSVVNINKNINEAGEISGSGIKKSGSTITLTATTNEGYTWLGWYYNGELYTEELSFDTMVTLVDMTYEARWMD